MILKDIHFNLLNTQKIYNSEVLNRLIIQQLSPLFDQSCTDRVIHKFSKYLMNFYYMPGTNLTLRKRNKFYFHEGYL